MSKISINFIAEKGYFCEFCEIQVVLPKEKRYIDSSNTWEIIGYSGVDGIEFRQQLKMLDEKVFAYYPIDDVYIEKAKSITDLILKWKRNELIL